MPAHTCTVGNCGKKAVGAVAAGMMRFPVCNGHCKEMKSQGIRVEKDTKSSTMHETNPGGR